MNKWIFRLTGILVMVLVSLIFLDSWLHPNVPSAIEKGVAHYGDTQKNVPKVDDGIPAPPPLSLTSVQREDNVQLTQASVVQADVEQEKQDDGTTSNAEMDQNVASQEDDLLPPPEPLPESEPQSTKSVPDTATVVATEPTSKQDPASIVSKVDTLPVTKVWLQAGSFSERGNASKRAAVIKAQGWVVDIAPAKVKGKTFYRVYVGPIQSNQVDAYLNKLHAMGIKAQKVNR